MPCRVMITGANGFVGGLMISALRDDPEVDWKIFATSRDPGDVAEDIDFDLLDVTNQDAVHASIERIRPDVILHLAGISAVAAASRDTNRAWAVNVFGVLNVARSMRQLCPQATLIFAGSGQVYGTSARRDRPLTENSLLQPDNEYAVTKAAADLALGHAALDGLHAVRFRPFNHTGPGQEPHFVFPDFARQIALIENGRQEPIIRTGNLDSVRNFLDARDVVAAYRLAMCNRADLPDGVILNLANEHSITIRQGLEFLIGKSPTKITVEQDLRRMRNSEIPVVEGSARKAMDLLNWKPRYPIETCLSDILAYWRAHV